MHFRSLRAKRPSPHPPPSMRTAAHHSLDLHRLLFFLLAGVPARLQWGSGPGRVAARAKPQLVQLYITITQCTCAGAGHGRNNPVYVGTWPTAPPARLGGGGLGWKGRGAAGGRRGGVSAD